MVAAVAGCLALGALWASVALAAGANVTTAAYNGLRDGWDPNEPGLGPAALRAPGFQKLFSTKLSGSIYAQPLLFEGTVVATTEKARRTGSTRPRGRSAGSARSAAPSNPRPSAAPT